MIGVIDIINMTYPEQLQTKEWKEKRKEILSRDDYKCSGCKNERLLSDMSLGLFKGYLYPNDYSVIGFDVIKSENFRGLLGQINDNYVPESMENTIIYYKEIQDVRYIQNGVNTKVYAIRRLTNIEIKTLNDFDAHFENKPLPKYKYYEDDIGKTEESLSPVISEIFKRRNDRSSSLVRKSPLKSSSFEFLYVLGLHIHHKYYIKKKLAWEYDNDALVTLCFKCHETLHKDHQVRVYNDSKEILGHYTNCKRCHGMGVFPEYKHVERGICFRCNGNRYEELIEPSS